METTDKRERINRKSPKIFALLDNVSKFPVDGVEGWVKETKSGLRDVLLIFFNICRSKSIDDYLLEELSEIIISYFILLEASLSQIPQINEENKNPELSNDNKVDVWIDDENSKKEYYLSILRNSLEIPSILLGRKQIIELMQHWILGSRGVFEAPIYGISHRGSSLVISKVYSIILNLIQKAFMVCRINKTGFSEENINHINFFCLPVIAGKTKSTELFSRINDIPTRLVSVEINLGSFFNIATGVVLTSHEAGHYLSPCDQGKLNRAFLELVLNEVADNLAMNIIYLPELTHNEEQISGLVDCVKVEILSWFTRDVLHFLQQACDKAIEEMTLKEFTSLVMEYFNEYSPVNSRRRGLDSLSKQLIKILPKKADSFLRKYFNIQRTKFTEANNKFLNIFIGNLFKFGLNENRESNRRKLSQSLEDLCYKCSIKNYKQSSDEKKLIEESQYLWEYGIKSAKFNYELVNESKADYFMNRLLGLDQERYSYILSKSSAYFYSSIENHNLSNQIKKREKILQLSDHFNFKGYSNSQQAESFLNETKVAGIINDVYSRVISEMFEEVEELTTLRDEFGRCFSSLDPKKMNLSRQMTFIESILKLEKISGTQI